MSYLDQVGDDAVGGTAADEVPLRFEELFGVESPEFLQEIF